jgi:cysteine desulfurase family protein (TIGR01976 family)
MKFDIDEIRSHFPSLKEGAVFFDNPGGTQVPREVIEAVSDYYRNVNSNTHGAFFTSERTDAIIDEARGAVADFLNSRSTEEIAFGANMTTLTFNVSRSISRELQAGDEVIVTRLDHDANIAPWVALEEKGVVVRWIDFHPEDCTLRLSDLEEFLSRRTKVVAVGYASNAVGTVNDVKRIVDLAHGVGALVFVDAVHYAPHGPIDVQVLDCDLLACSAYKFYGPHLGVLYGKYDLLDRLTAYKVRPAENKPPHKFETGTLNHEGIAGVIAAVNYLASIGEKCGNPFAEQYGSLSGRRLHIKTAMSAIKAYERDLFFRLMTGLQKISGVKTYGIIDPVRFGDRTPTLALTVEGITPRGVAERLGKENIYVWDGNYYAIEVMERLGLEGHGGAVRAGLAHYNTDAEVDLFVSEMLRIRQSV